MFALSEYDYELPPELIAQHPVQRRDDSRLLCLDRGTGQLDHRSFAVLPELLTPGDALVVNNTRVIPGRLLGRKSSGGKAELLILDYGKRADHLPDSHPIYTCLVKTAKPPQPGTRVFFDDLMSAEILDGGQGRYRVRFDPDGDFENVLQQLGRIPLPPYIKRDGGEPGPSDRENYQTVYATRKGAIAAPTAGLHFTEAMIRQIRDAGVAVFEITLHVGYGTFLPIREKDIRRHQMHSETFFISEDVADGINRVREKGGRIVAVGTTSVRTLEYAADPAGRIRAVDGECDLYIYPGYRFTAVDAMITNFHLPRSSLLLLVSAFAGRENIFRAYREAVEQRYRFFSYGDAMLIHK